MNAEKPNSGKNSCRNQKLSLKACEEINVGTSSQNWSRRSKRLNSWRFIIWLSHLQRRATMPLCTTWRTPACMTWLLGQSFCIKIADHWPPGELKTKPKIFLLNNHTVFYLILYRPEMDAVYTAHGQGSSRNFTNWNICARWMRIDGWR